MDALGLLLLLRVLERDINQAVEQDHHQDGNVTEVLGFRHCADEAVPFKQQ